MLSTLPIIQAKKDKLKKALITGATGGLGRALAHKLSEEGLQLILVGRSLEKLNTLAFPSSQVFALDLHDCTSLIKLIEDEKPDLIINNAGFGYYGKTTDLSTEEQLSILEINGKALMEITIEAAKMFLKEKKKGVILNISSIASMIPTPWMSAYGASKAFVTHFSQSLDYELRSQNVRVLVCCPGQFSSEFASKASKKRIQPPKNVTFSAEGLAHFLWKQIKKEKPFTIYDFRYRLLYQLRGLIPHKWISHFIKKELQSRLK